MNKQVFVIIIVVLAVTSLLLQTSGVIKAEVSTDLIGNRDGIIVSSHIPVEDLIGNSNQESVSSEAETVIPFSDDFNSPVLDTRWRILNQDSTHWSLTASSGNFRIIGKVEDLWGSCNSMSNLLLQDAPNDDFTIQTKVNIYPTSDYQQGGLIIYFDVENYIKLDVLYSEYGGGQSIELELCEKVDTKNVLIR